MSLRKGDMVVAIHDHSQGAYKSGEMFPVKSVRTNWCGCGGNQIDIGIRSHAGVAECKVCNRLHIEDDTIWFMHERGFKPAMTFKEETYMVNQVVDALLMPR